MTKTNVTLESVLPCFDVVMLKKMLNDLHRQQKALYEEACERQLTVVEEMQLKLLEDAAIEVEEYLGNY